VTESLMAGWYVLEALNDVFAERVGGSAGAKLHQAAKKRLDSMAEYESSLRTYASEIEKLKRRTAEIQQRGNEAQAPGRQPTENQDR
jgi:hypothetical protein